MVAQIPTNGEIRDWLCSCREVFKKWVVTKKHQRSSARAVAAYYASSSWSCVCLQVEKRRTSHAVRNSRLFLLTHSVQKSKMPSSRRAVLFTRAGHCHRQQQFSAQTG